MKKKEKTSSNRKKSFYTLSRSGLLLWSGLIFFICAWMFVLGILVGREMAPVKFNIEKLQNELTALKEAVIKKELDRYNIDSNTNLNKSKMRFYETLKKTGKKDRLKTGRVEEKRKPLTEKKVDSVTRKPGSLKKNPVIQNNQEEHSKKSVDANKNYTIQVASYKDLTAAERRVTELKKKGYAAYRRMGKIPGKGIWYRVRVGYFKDKADAGETLNQLRKEEVDAIVVQR